MATPFACYLAVPDPYCWYILSMWAFVGFSIGLMCFMLGDVLAVFHWWDSRKTDKTVAAVEQTLTEMGYASARNAKQHLGGRHGRP